MWIYGIVEKFSATAEHPFCYIGVTSKPTFLERFEGHKRKAALIRAKLEKKRPLTWYEKNCLAGAIARHGEENYTIEGIQRVRTKEEAALQEVLLIQQYHTHYKNIRQGVIGCYNISLGGDSIKETEASQHRQWLRDLDKFAVALRHGKPPPKGAQLRWLKSLEDTSENQPATPHRRRR